MTDETIRITLLVIENTGPIQVFECEPKPTGLTIIGGDNEQGKTAAIASACWALGGKKRAPAVPQRKGSALPPKVHVELSNGLIIDRAGKNSALTVKWANGKPANQSTLDALISEIALDLPKFMQANNKEKALILLDCLGIGEDLSRIDNRIDGLYQQRQDFGRELTTAKKLADGLPRHMDAPKEAVSVAELVKQQREADAQNRTNDEERGSLAQLGAERGEALEEIEHLETELAQIRERIASEGKKLKEYDMDIAKQQAVVAKLADIDTSAIVAQIESAEEINAKVAANDAKRRALADAADKQKQYDAMTEQLEEARTERLKLIERSPMPYPGLGFENGEITLDGIPWDGMSGEQQQQVAVAIAKGHKPNCRFAFLDGLEQQDMGKLARFGKWLEDHDMQILGTRVSTGPECDLIMVDGVSTVPEKGKR